MVTPIAGIFSASAKPRAAETPTRTPVNDPGPTDTTIGAEFGESDAASGQRFLDDGHQMLGMALAEVAHRAAKLPARVSVS